MTRAIVWFRQDLRLTDNAALSAALFQCDEVIPVFIDDDTSESVTQLGEASRVWLHHSLSSLAGDLAGLQSKLILRQGKALECLQELVSEMSATHVFWNRCYEPQIRQRDEQIKSALKQVCNVQSFRGNVLFEPWEMAKQDGSAYRVFTPYWNEMQKRLVDPDVLSKPAELKFPDQNVLSLSLGDLQLLSQHHWHKDMMAHWQVGESAAMKQLLSFLDESVTDYEQQRDLPSVKGTSRLSPHLHFGEISPSQIYAGIKRHGSSDESVTYLRQIAWREFAYHLLFYFPETVQKPFNEKFTQFLWNEYDEVIFSKWKNGKTGFPIIDAGMRELWETGWMHNRVRMIVASFLTKNLLIHWQQGEDWFRNTLVDADVANNVMGWQWVAGSGADAAPYFRVFNPLLQSKKFDAEGGYIRRWVPELATLDAKQIHEPSSKNRKQCGYVEPMVDLKKTRLKALARYDDMKALQQ